MNWNEQFKIRIANSSDSMRKHEIVKTLIVCEIMNKTKKERKYHEIYTEHPVGKGKVCDVYHKNLKTGDTYHYEIQKRVSKAWLSKTMKYYDSKFLNWQLVDLNKLSENWIEINKKIKELVLI